MPLKLNQNQKIKSNRWEWTLLIIRQPDQSR